jgi:hypothetical protein
MDYPLPLHLFVLGVDVANNPHFAFAADDFAFFTDALNAWSNFHFDGTPP